MSRVHALPLLPAAILAAAMAFAAPARAIDQPDCSALEQWSAGHASTATQTLAPKVEVGGLFADDRTVPVFGAPVAQWEARDFAQLGRWISSCRRDAGKRRDKLASDHLYQALKVARTSARAVGRMAQFHAQSVRAVDNLVAYHRSPELIEALGLARRALAGDDVTADVRQLPVTRSVQQEVLTLQKARDYLADADNQALVDRLSEGADAVQQQMASQDAAFEALQRELAQVPMTAEGARTLDQLNRDPVLRKMTRQQAQDFQNAVMKKRIAISRRLQSQQQQHASAQPTSRQQQQQAPPSAPVPVTARLEKLLLGDDVEDLSIGGVRPGVAYEKARQIIEQRFGLHAGATAAMISKEFTPTRGDLANYTRTEQRDGGDFQIETMRDVVGQVKFIEHYTGTMDLDAARNWLTERLGKPEQFTFTGDGVVMTWEDDGSHLTVRPANRTALQYRSPRTYKSSLVVILWSDDYRQFLVDAKERCRELRNKPSGELSVQDKMDMLSGCRS